MKNIVIFGAGGFGREVAIMVGSINAKSPYSYNLIGYVVDEQYFIPEQCVNGLPVVGDFQWLIDHKDEVSCIVAIGDSEDRKNAFERMEKNGISVETIISPDVYVDPTCTIGEGVYIGHRVVVSVNSTFGKGTFINTDVALGHDVVCGEFVSIGPRTTISGNCVIEDMVEIGGGAYIIPKKKIRKGAVVAAGSVVFSNVKANTHVIGNPAKRIDL